MSDRMTSAHTGRPCPPWCRRTHAATSGTLMHRATVADFQLDELLVTVVLAYAEPVDDRAGIGPHARIDMRAGDEDTDLDLSPGQVRILAQVLGREGGAALLAEALATAASALDVAGHQLAGGETCG